MPHQNFDLSSLYLIKDETQVILKDAEKHLSEYSDDIDAAPLLLDSALVLGQLSQVFHLIGFVGADALAQKIADGLSAMHKHESQDDETIMDISEAIMVLDRYVELVLLKEKTSPKLLLPILQKLAVRLGQDTPSDGAFDDYISIDTPQAHYVSLKDLSIDLQNLVTAYRAGLWSLLRDGAERDNRAVQAMVSAARQIAQASGKLFWQAAFLLTQDIAQTNKPLSASQKRLLVYVEQQLQDYLPIEDKRFGELVGAAAMHHADFAQIVKQSTSNNNAMQKFLFCPDRATTDTLNQIIQEEIKLIKERVDALARGELQADGEQNAQSIADDIDALAQVMYMLRLQDAHNALSNAATRMRAWQTPNGDDLDALLTALMAGENAAIFLAKSHTPGAIKLPLHNRHISLHALDVAYEALVQESRANLNTIINAVESQQSAPAPELMAQIVESCEQLVGAYRFLYMPKSALLAERAAAALAGIDALNAQNLPHVANVIAALEHHLDCTHKGLPLNDSVWTLAQQSLQKIA